MTLDMIKNPLKVIDLHINLEKKRFTKDSEELLIKIYTFEEHISNYIQEDGSTLRCPFKECGKILDYPSRLLEHASQHVLINDSQVKN
jgi:hypothetical protein